MEHWDGKVLNIKAPPGVQDVISYSYGKATALSTLLSEDYVGLANVIWEVHATQAEIMEADINKKEKYY